MCTVAEICSTGVRVTLSDVPEVLLTATNSEPQVQDAGLAAKAGTHTNGIGLCPVPFFFGRALCADWRAPRCKPFEAVRRRPSFYLTFNPTHALLADEVRTGRSEHRRSRECPATHAALDGRAQLSGAQLHARRHEDWRRRAVLPLQLP